MSELEHLRDKSVSLVLGSGGARGLAHIGVIEVLNEAGARIEAIAGSSMGALVGGVHAAGKLERYAEWVRTLEQSDVLGLLDWNFTGGGLFRGRKIIDKLEELIGDCTIESLDIDYTAVAVDLDRGREVWLSNGSLFEAIRASIAIPGIFTPHRYRGRTLVDGGLLNPVPVAPTLRTITDLTLVVDVNGPPMGAHEESEQQQSEGDDSGVWARLKEWADGFKPNRQLQSAGPGLIATMVLSLEIMEGAITRHQMASFQPDMTIRIPKNACMIHEFHRADEVIDLGRKLARESLQQDQGESNADRPEPPA